MTTTPAPDELATMARLIAELRNLDDEIHTQRTDLAQARNRIAVAEEARPRILAELAEVCGRSPRPPTTTTSSPRSRQRQARQRCRRP